MVDETSATSDPRTRLEASATGQGDGLRQGLWVSYLSPYALEITAGWGPDWIGIDLQHGDLELHDLPGLLRVAESRGLPLLVRTPSQDPAVLGRVLDAGASGVIVPLVESAQQARALVAATRTPPSGSRSTGGCRATLGLSPAPSLPLLLPMVETKAGLDNAADILAVPGVDGVFVGPYDLSLSAGYPAPDSTPTIQALREVIRLARTGGKIAGFMAGMPDLAAVAPEADLVAIDTDVSALRLGLGRIFD